jgi:outer membrane protein OmpA-like peptidoglycan-associated protein
VESALAHRVAAPAPRLPSTGGRQSIGLDRSWAAAGMPGRTGVRDWTRTTADLLAVQRLAGNRAATAVVGGEAARTVGELPRRRRPAAVAPRPAVRVAPAGRSEPTAQRAPEDTKVTDLSPESEEHPETIFFGFDSAAIPATEQPKIPALAARFADQSLTLKGTASEEGASAYNKALTDRRIAAVESAFSATTHDKGRTPLNKSEAKGSVDYRQVRSVEIIPATQSPDPECAAEPGLVTCDPGLVPAMSDAIDQIAPAAGKLAGAAPDSDEMTLFETLFRTKDDATRTAVLGHLGTLARDLTTARDVVKAPCGPTPSPPFHQCEGERDSGCETGAFAFETSRHLTFCPKFMTTGGLPGVAATGDETRRHIILHEGAHLALDAGDIAKSTQRAFTFISTSEALNNADSFAVLVRNLNNPTASPTGPINKDEITGVSAAEAAALRPPIDEALAWLEKWIEFSDLETSQLYRGAADHAQQLADIVEQALRAARRHDLAEDGDGQVALADAGRSDEEQPLVHDRKLLGEPPADGERAQQAVVAVGDERRQVAVLVALRDARGGEQARRGGVAPAVAPHDDLASVPVDGLPA